jgi:hypothetical protein
MQGRFRMYEALIIIIAVVLISALILGWRNWRKQEIRRSLEIQIPWLLLLAFRQQDEESHQKLKSLQNSLLLRADREYELTTASLLNLITDTIEKVGTTYFPSDSNPVKRLSLKQFNDLLQRIVFRIEGLLGVFPFSIAASVNIATVKSVKRGVDSVRKSKIYQGVMNSPLGAVVKRIPFLKIAQAIRIGKRIVTPMGIVLEAGSQLGKEAFKRLLLREISGIVTRESINTFSGGVVWRSKERAHILALWLASRTLRETEHPSGASLTWIQKEAVSINDRPDGFMRFLLAYSLKIESENSILLQEILASGKQASRRMDKEYRWPKGEWFELLKLESLRAAHNLERADIFAEKLSEFSLTLNENSESRTRLEQLIAVFQSDDN